MHPEIVSAVPGHCSLLVLLGPHSLQQVVQFVAGLQLQAQISLILRRTYNVTKEGGDVKATWFHQMHQINEDSWRNGEKSN